MGVAVMVRREECPVSEPTIEEMRKALGLDKCQPIRLTPSDAADFCSKGDPFREWYEEELRNLYRQLTS